MTLIPFLLACYDFEGELGQIGFVSDLRIDHRTAWTPEYGVAGRTQPSFYAVADLTAEDEGEEMPVLQAASDREFLAEEDNLIKLLGPRRGSVEVWFEGELQDEFEVDFRPADEVVLIDSAGEELSEIALVPGAEVALGLRVLDGFSRPLGWREPDLSVEGDDGISAWTEGGRVYLVGAAEGGLHMDLLHGDGFVPVEVGGPSRQDIEIVHETEDAQVLQHRAWTEDGVRLFGVAPQWPEGVEVLGPDLALLGG
jgi:hypothetical protein